MVKNALRTAVRFSVGMLALWAISRCMADGGPTPPNPQDYTVTDPYPLRLSDLWLPMEGRPIYQFYHVEYDKEAKPVLVADSSKMVFVRLRDSLFGWENGLGQGGLLLQRRRSGPLDSLGLYVVGSYADSADLRFTAPELWLPDFPNTSMGTWTVGNRQVTVMAVDTLVLLPIWNAGNAYHRDKSTGRYPVRVTLLRESQDSLATYYSFLKGVGVVAYHRSQGGRLLSTGILTFAVATSISANLWPR